MTLEEKQKQQTNKTLILESQQVKKLHKLALLNLLYIKIDFSLW